MTWLVDPAVVVWLSEKLIFVPSLKTVRIVPFETTTLFPPPPDEIVSVYEVDEGMLLWTIHSPPTVYGI